MEKNHRKKDIRYIEYLSGISKNIKLLRTGLGWSQQTLAEKAGVSRNTIQSAEGGAEISLKKLIDISEALEVDLAGEKKTKSK